MGFCGGIGREAGGGGGPAWFWRLSGWGSGIQGWSTEKGEDFEKEYWDREHQGWEGEPDGEAPTPTAGVQGKGRTCRDDGLHARAIDEGPFDGLCPHIGPVDTLLAGIVVQHGDVVNIRDREGDDVVVVGGL